MAKVNTTASDKVKDSAAAHTEPFIPDLTLSGQPTVITAVQRKVNIGNFETVDIYMAVSLPLQVNDLMNPEGIQTALAQAAEYGFYMVSKETGDRYKLVKGDKS